MNERLEAQDDGGKQGMKCLRKLTKLRRDVILSVVRSCVGRDMTLSVSISVTGPVIR